MIDIDSYLIKFPEEQRTFKSRLEFIFNIFNNPYSKTEIMARCVQHKLKRSLETYEQTTNRSTLMLSDKNPLTVLKKFNK